MKKIILCFLLICLTYSTNVYAKQYDTILGAIVENNGLFDGREGVVYADVNKFGNLSGLLVVSIKNDTIECILYPEENIEGKKLSFMFGGNSRYVLSVATMGDGNNCLILDTNDNREVYAYVGDRFKMIFDAGVYEETKIAEYHGEGIICHKNPADVYLLINSEKKNRINSSKFTNCKNQINIEKLTKIKSLIAAAADVVSFDINDYDYMKLLKNILYTSANYEHICDMSRDYKIEYDEAKGDKISSVNGEFVDTVLKNNFGVKPQHMSVYNLAENDFCYVNGRYYFSGGYANNFLTKIEDVPAVYDLGKGRYYVLFSDTYYEEDIIIPEIGYAIVDTKESEYKLVKLSVGKDILSDEQIKQYSNRQGNSLFLVNGGDPILYVREREYMINILLGVSIVAVCIACMAIIFGIVLKRK